MNEKAVDEKKVEQLTLVLKRALIGIVVLSIVGTFYLFIQRQSEKTEMEGFALLYEAEKAERELGMATNPFDPSFYEKMSEWSEDQKKSYENALSTVVAEKSSTQAAQLARLRLARIHFERSESEKAQALLEEVRDSGTSEMIRAQALQDLGTLHESREDFEGALKAFERASSLEDSPLRPLSLLSQARVLRSLEKNSEAAALYETVIEKYPNSVFEKQARALNLMGAE